MDKTMQAKDQMQDDEIYALLEQALEQEKLCVSEDLIQKTLQKIAEQENASNVVDYNAGKNKKHFMMKYAGVVAAAALLVVVGVGVGLSGGFRMGGMNNKADIMPISEARNRSSVAESEAYHSENASDALMDAEAVALNEQAVEEDLPEDSDLLSTVPIDLTDDLKREIEENVGIGEVRRMRYWRYSGPEETWETQLIQALKECGQERKAVPQEGMYEYTVVDRDDGLSWTVGSEEPLSMIMEIGAERGTIWCLFGENVTVYIQE